MIINNIKLYNNINKFSMVVTTGLYCKNTKYFSTTVSLYSSSNNSDFMNFLNNNINVSNEDFKELTSSDRDTMLKDLSDFKLQLGRLDLENKKELYLNFQNSMNVLKQRSYKLEEKWNTDFLNRHSNVDQLKPLSIKDLKGFVEIREFNKNNPIEITEKIKPLGNFGDISLNELINKFNDHVKPLVELTIENADTIKPFLPFIPTLILYRGVVNYFKQNSFGDVDINKLPQKEKMNFIRYRANSIKQFMLCTAPAVVIMLTFAKKNLLINVQADITVSNKEIMEKSLFSFLFKKKLPFWAIQIIFAVLSIIFMKKYLGISGVPDILLSNNPWIKWLFIFWMVSSFILFLSNLTSLLVYYLFIKNKISIPDYLPQSIKNWLFHIYEISQFENKSLFADIFYQNVLMHLFVFVMCTFIYIYYF